MRPALFALLPLLAANPAFAESNDKDCTKDVLTAFEKQRTSKAFRVQMTQPTAEGPASMTIDYAPPDKMLQTVTSPAMPGEQQTMLVGSRAFAGSNGAYEELLPQFTQSIVAEVQTAVGKPQQDIGTYLCGGSVKYSGQDLLAFHLKVPDVANGLSRTIYVDPATGLPAFNVVAPVAGGEAVMTATYSYPANIEIIAPENAPVQKIR